MESMNMKFPKRFGLSTLLLLMFVVAAVLGFVTWRANRLRSEVVRINKEGIGHLTLADGWLFPALGEESFLKLKKDINGGLHIAEKNEPRDVVIAKFEETAEQMRDLGADEVQILYTEERHHQGDTVDVLMVVHTDNMKRAVTSISEPRTTRY